MWPFKRKKTSGEAPPVQEAPKSPGIAISDEMLAEVGHKKRREFEKYEPPAGVIPDGIRSAILAMDATPYDSLNGSYPDYVFGGLSMANGSCQAKKYVAGVDGRRFYRDWSNE